MSATQLVKAVGMQPVYLHAFKRAILVPKRSTGDRCVQKPTDSLASSLQNEENFYLQFHSPQLTMLSANPVKKMLAFYCILQNGQGPTA